MKAWKLAAGMLGVLAALPIFAADLTVSYTQPAATAIDWDGIDNVDGNGTLTFTALGDTQTATLRVLCNSANGYQITFNTANATSATASEVKNGGTGIPYTVVMSTSGISNATISTSSLVLNNPSTASVDVNFNGGGDTLPLDGATQANEIQLQMTLSDLTGELYPQGTYTDVITATIALN